MADKKTAAQLLREMVERDPVAHGRALARGYGVGPQTVQVPESLIESAERLAGQLESNADAHQETEGTERRRAAAMIRALLSQPTPSAEPFGTLDAHLDALGLRDPDEPARPDDLPFPQAKAHKMLSAPPSIAAMVPGTTFVYGDSARWEVSERGLASGRLIVNRIGRGDTRYLDELDPSTIRDVTPPKET